MEGRGFYKFDRGKLLYAKEYVNIPGTVELTRENMHLYQLPIDGWYYFDNVVQAEAFFMFLHSDVVTNRLS
jgi:hypothetical protein